MYNALMLCAKLESTTREGFSIQTENLSVITELIKNSKLELSALVAHEFCKTTMPNYCSFINPLPKTSRTSWITKNAFSSCALTIFLILAN